MKHRVFIRLPVLLLVTAALLLSAFSMKGEAASSMAASELSAGELLTDDDGDGIINYKFCYKGATV